MRSERVSVQIRAEESATCSDIKLPQKWTVPDSITPGSEAEDLIHGGFDVGSSKFEIRKRDRLLLGVYAQYFSETRFYSSDYYALVPIQRIGVREWEGAEVVLPFEKAASGKLASGQSLGFQHRFFAPSGSNWAFPENSRVSRDENYLALHSWNGIIQIDLTVPKILRGTYFIDLYRVSPLRRVALIYGDFSNVDPQRFISRAFWIEGNMYVVPLSDDLRRFAICQF